MTLDTEAGDLFVTLNPPTPPEASKTVRKLKLAHPVFGAASAEAQRRLPSIQGPNPLQNPDRHGGVIYIHTYIHIYIYICVCLCMCVCIYIYVIYIYIYGFRAWW